MLSSLQQNIIQEKKLKSRTLRHYNLQQNNGINLQQTNWEIMTSTNEYKSTVHEIMKNSNFQEILRCTNAGNLDVFWTGTGFWRNKSASMLNSHWNEHSKFAMYLKNTARLKQSGVEAPKVLHRWTNFKNILLHKFSWTGAASVNLVRRNI